jgi:hypothetical protein
MSYIEFLLRPTTKIQHRHAARPPRVALALRMASGTHVLLDGQHGYKQMEGPARTPRGPCHPAVTEPATVTRAPAILGMRRKMPPAQSLASALVAEERWSLGAFMQAFKTPSAIEASGRIRRPRRN